MYGTKKKYITSHDISPQNFSMFASKLSNFPSFHAIKYSDKLPNTGTQINNHIMVHKGPYMSSLLYGSNIDPGIIGKRDLRTLFVTSEVETSKYLI